MKKALSWLRDLSGGKRPKNASLSDEGEGRIPHLDEGAGFIT
ncbi:MAG: hypothetical protein WC755_08595 [Candidatus Woesearchaeota archaeon]|jgi:hypothetical protein